MNIIKLIQENWDTIQDSFGQILALLAICGISIDLMPWIHINPVRAIFKYIGNVAGKYIAGIVNRSLDGVRVELDKQNNQIRNIAHGLLDMSDRFDKKELEDIRWEILDFGNKIRRREIILRKLGIISFLSMTIMRKSSKKKVWRMAKWI